MNMNVIQDERTKLSPQNIITVSSAFTLMVMSFWIGSSLRAYTLQMRDVQASIERQWSTSDQQTWATHLAYRNPKFVVPDALDVKENRRVENISVARTRDDNDAVTP